MDEKSVMTFLSQFPRAQPQTPRGRISGVDKEPVVGRETHFSVELDRAQPAPLVQVRDPDGRPLRVGVRPAEEVTGGQDSTATLYHVSYEPEKPGKHEVSRFSK